MSVSPDRQVPRPRTSDSDEAERHPAESLLDTLVPWFIAAAVLAIVAAFLLVGLALLVFTVRCAWEAGARG